MLELMAWDLFKQRRAELQRMADCARLVREARSQRRRGEQKAEG